MIEQKQDVQAGMAAATDVGLVRKENEDAFYYSPEHKFFVVCDGMGGHASGALASRLACETVRDVLSGQLEVDLEKACEDVDDELPEPAMRLLAAVRLANRRVITHAASNPQFRGMGSTLVAAVLHDGWIFTANVGDSRIYRLRDNKLEALTKDHSWINELLEDQEISEQEVQDFSKKNVLTRALGIYPTVKVDLRIENTREGDAYLFCSDGLHNALADELIHSVLSAPYETHQDMVSRIVALAKQMDGSDNITAGVIHISDNAGDALAPTVFEKTLSDESEKVGAFLTRLIKGAYAVPVQKNKLPNKLFAYAAAAAALIILAVFFWQQNGQEAGHSPVLNSGLLAGESRLSPTSFIPQASDAPISEAGTLVLLQVTDKTHLDLLRSLRGARILDELSEFTRGLPVYAGTYTWAVADSTQKIIYQKQNIYLESVANRKSNDFSAQTRNAETIGDREPSARSRNQQTNENRGLIYLVGSFSAEAYDEASIFVNDSRLGDLKAYLENGFYLRPGVYAISIRDREGNIIREKSDNRIAGGDILAVEF